MSGLEPPTVRVPLDEAWLNKFGNDQEERFAISVSPARNWGGKGAHLMVSLYRADGRCPEEYAAIKRSEVEVLHAAIGAWLEETAS